MYLGAHLGIAQGLDVAAAEAERIGCESLQIFAKSPQMWKGPPISPEAAAGFRAAVAAHHLRATAVHHGYLLNLAHPSDARRAQSERAFRDELDRAELLGVDALIFHPGAHLGSGVEAGVARIADALNAAIAATPTYRVRALLENSAGQGTTVGSRFEELAEVLDRVSRPDRVGVTLDTCHLFAAGFDFRTPEGYGEMMDHVRGTIRIERVRAFHLNDSKSDLGAHLDRHENIGAGKIGREAFRALINDPRWAAVPGFLETPLDDDDYVRYARDLQTLRSLRSRPRKTAARRSRPRRASTIK
ncbi:MAG: deoxyribonuclease IV [Candidatus Thermoplasmatota archaeon]|nr:deoxyribonuclease IV [Candidatus Thermoplasmatota archaeon]MCL5983157.1 deoxyribonuclease IV [Candidatus Thermoplasmatota archaeon]